MEISYKGLAKDGLMALADESIEGNNAIFSRKWQG